MHTQIWIVSYERRGKRYTEHYHKEADFITAVLRVKKRPDYLHVYAGSISRLAR